MIRSLYVSVLLAGLLCTAQVQAQDSSPLDRPTEHADALDEAEARSHFDAGYSYFQEARYEDALREFERAYELSPRPALLFNMSQCYERLGRLDEAIQRLEQYITTDALSDRAFQERRLANLRGRQRGSSEASSEAVELIAPDSERDVASTPRQEAGAMTAQPEGPSQVAREVAPEDGLASGQESTSSSDALAYTFLGVGAAGLITMGVAGGLALSEKSRLREDCAAGCAESETTSLRTRALVADIGLGIGLAGAAVGLILLLTSGDDEGEARAQVAPAIGASAAGATLQVRY